jgi:hypothetical protein
MQLQDLPTTSYVLATLTASGGVIGFARTGSIPSVAAGCTVGLLCMLPATSLFAATSDALETVWAVIGSKKGSRMGWNYACLHRLFWAARQFREPFVFRSLSQ